MTRFGNRGTEQVVLVTTLADKAAPTATEIAGGIVLTSVIRNDTVTGFLLERGQLDGDDLSTTFSRRYPGIYSEVDASIDIYRSDDPGSLEEQAVAALPEDTTGYLIFGTAGSKNAIAAGDLVEVWPIQVRSNDVANRGTNELRRNTIKVSITDMPERDIPVLPTLVGIEVTPATLSLDLSDGDVEALVATATWSDSSTTTVTAQAAWVSSDPLVASVAAGTVTAVGVGTATVTATYRGESDTCAVTVTA